MGSKNLLTSKSLGIAKKSSHSQKTLMKRILLYLSLSCIIAINAPAIVVGSNHVYWDFSVSNHGFSGLSSNGSYVSATSRTAYGVTHNSAWKPDLLIESITFDYNSGIFVGDGSPNNITTIPQNNIRNDGYMFFDSTSPIQDSITFVAFDGNGLNESAAAYDFDLDVTSTQLSANYFRNFLNIQNYNYFVATNGMSVGPDAFHFSINGDFANPTVYDIYAIAYGFGEIPTELAIVPEPSTYALLIGCVALSSAFLRRRFKS